MPRTTTLPLVAAAALAALGVPSLARASCMCMFRPPPVDSNLADGPKNPATAVFLLRDGTRTVMTVEPAYEGPRTELSMIVPLPNPITRDDIRTISGHHFRRVDRATAPRLRHRWDACPGPLRARRRAARGRSGGAGLAGEPLGDELGVEIEESWDVDEYDVSLLSAAQSTGLLTFLRERGLELPPRAAPVLRSYIEAGHRFALIEVDPSRARQVGERMVLDPIQLHFDSEELRVPVRLGTLNSPGEQELLLYVLSRDGRYEVANREALVAPSEITLRESYEGGFGPFYAGLMDELYRRHPGATVTEFARPIVGFSSPLRARMVWWFGLDRHVERTEEGRPNWRDLRRWTLSRIRYRYGADLDDDLVLRPADAIVTDRSWPRGANGFSVRFFVDHDGETCPSWRARRAQARQWATADALWSGEALRPTETGVWPGDAIAEPVLDIAPGSSRPVVAEAPEPEDPAPAAAPPEPEPEPGSSPPAARASACAVTPGSGTAPLWLALAALALGWRRRRRS